MTETFLLRFLKFQPVPYDLLDQHFKSDFEWMKNKKKEDFYIKLTVNLNVLP